MKQKHTKYTQINRNKSTHYTLIIELMILANSSLQGIISVWPSRYYSRPS